MRLDDDWIEEFKAVSQAHVYEQTEKYLDALWEHVRTSIPALLDDPVATERIFTLAVAERLVKIADALQGGQDTIAAARKILDQ